MPLFFFTDECDVCHKIRAFETWLDPALEPLLSVRTVQLVDRPAFEFERGRAVENPNGTYRMELERVTYPAHRRCVPHAATENRDPPYEMTYEEAEAFLRQGPS